MAQPQKYDRTHDFEGDDDLSKSALNTELDNVSVSINGLRENLALIQNDDGSLKAGVVTIDSLAPDILDHMSGELKEAVESAATFANSASLSATAAIQAKDNTYQLYLDTEALHDGVVKMNNQTSENATIVVNKTKEVVELREHVDSQKQAVDLLTKRAETAATSASNDKTSVAEMKASVDKSEQNVTQLTQSASDSQKAAALSEANAKKSEQTAVEAKEQAEEAANKALTQLHAVSYIPQSLTEEQKEEARKNIGVMSSDEISDNYLTKNGIAVAASKLESPVAIAISGFITGSATSFDGSNNISINVTNIDGTKVSGSVPVASKLGTATVGSTTKPMYLNAGVPTASSSTVGSNLVPVYLSGGVITSTGRTMIHTGGGQTISGALNVTGLLKGGTVQSTSDRRLKTDIEPLENLSIQGLSAYRYTLKTDGKIHIGLIAQEVKKIMPEAVSADEKGYLSLDYNSIVALLVTKVNEQEKRIRELEGM